MTEREVAFFRGSDFGSDLSGGIGSDFSSHPKGGKIATASKNNATGSDKKATNRHPADELADVRASIAKLQDREKELREILIADPAKRDGDEFTVRVSTATQSSVDREAIEKAMGKGWLDKFLNKYPVTRLTVKERIANED